MVYDVIIAGAGMGGLSAGSLLAKKGKKVLILEAARVAGGCSSSFIRKGYIFESGATTLMGFDEKQPLHYLQKELGLKFPVTPIDPAMTVWQHKKPIIRYKNIDEWIKEAEKTFGGNQRKFWKLCYKISELVWKVALKNKYFPPQNLSDWWHLITHNNPLDAFLLRYSFISVKDVLKKMKLDNNPDFVRFIDEQLMITAQNTSEHVNMFIGAAMLCYTNYTNYYAWGGLISFVSVFTNYIEQHQGTILYENKVKSITYQNNLYQVHTEKGEVYHSHQVITNLPIWNLPDIVQIPELNRQFTKNTEKRKFYWSAFSVGIVIQDVLPKDITLHHQIILNKPIPLLNSHSIFVSISHPEDKIRNAGGVRIINISTHAPNPEVWFEPDFDIKQKKKELHEYIINALLENFSFFKREDIVYTHASSPKTWQKWVFRKNGNVGGVPQTMNIKPWQMISPVTKHKNFFICGDTVYPGQGIAGVALSGILTACRIK